MEQLPRQLVAIDKAKSLDRLAGVSFGRIVYTQRAMPAIRPVNHIVDGGAVIVYTHLGTGRLSTKGVVVAYEADDIDPGEHLGWSVIVTGLAAPVRDPDEVARYKKLLRPWVNGASNNEIIRIQPEFVTGYQLTQGDDHSTERRDQRLSDAGLWTPEHTPTTTPD
jgi:hypothetical protein